MPEAQSTRRRSRGVWAFVAACVVAAAGAVAWQYMSIVGGIGRDYQLAANPRVETALGVFDQLNEAKTFILDGHYEDGLKAIQKAKANAEPNSNFAWEAELQTGHAYRGLGDFKKAEASYQRVIAGSDSEIKVGRARIGIAIARALAGDSESAVQSVNALVNEYAATGQADLGAKALFAVANVHRARGHMGAMRAALARVEDEFPGSERTYANRALRLVARIADVLAAKQPALVKKTLAAGATQVGSIASGVTVSWPAANGPYLIEEELTVPADTTLNIGAGAVLRFGVQGGLHVMGRLEAVGTPDAPIVCRILADDPSASWWRGFRFGVAEGIQASVVKGVHFTSAEIAVAATSGTVEVTDCEIDQPIRYGLLSQSSGKIVGRNCRILGGAYEGIRCENGGELTLTKSRVAGQGMAGISVKTTQGVVLTDVLVEENRDAGIMFLDGSVGRLTNCRIRANRRAGVLCRGDAKPELVGCEIVGNGAEGLSGAVRSNPIVRSTRIQDNKGGGIHLNASGGTIADSHIQGNGHFGIWCHLSSPEITGNWITANEEVGVLIDQGQPILHRNAFTATKGLAVRNRSGNVIDARENWWGTVDPNAIGKLIEDGRDDPERGNVNFDPPLASRPPAGKAR